MAVKEIQYIRLGEPQVRKAQWVTIENGDSGEPTSEFKRYSDKSFQVTGTFNGATITIEGSNDPRANPNHADHASAEWDILNDPQGNPLTFTAEKTEQCLEITEWIRPIESGGGVSTDLTTIVFGRK